MKSSAIKVSLVVIASLSLLYVLISASVGVELEREIKQEIAKLTQRNHISPSDVELTYSRGWFHSTMHFYAILDSGQIVSSEIKLQHNPHIDHQKIRLVTADIRWNIDGIDVQSRHSVSLDDTVDTVEIEPFTYGYGAGEITVSGSTIVDSTTNQSAVTVEAKTDHITIDSQIQIHQPAIEYKQLFADHRDHLTATIKQIEFQDTRLTDILISGSANMNETNLQLQANFQPEETHKPATIKITTTEKTSSHDSQYHVTIDVSDPETSQTSQLKLDIKGPLNDEDLFLELDILDTHYPILLAHMPDTVRELLKNLTEPNETGYHLSISYVDHTLIVNDQPHDLTDWVPNFDQDYSTPHQLDYFTNNWS